MPSIVLPPNGSTDLAALAARVTTLEATPLGNPRGALVPGSIATLTLTSAPERDPKTGNDVATITATWTAPTDTQPVAYYNIRFSYDAGTTWSALDQVYGLTTIIHNLLLNKSVKVGVRAVTPSGVQGPETQNTITTQFDVTAPNTPSTPTGSAGALQFTAIWDGKDSGAASLLASAPDLAMIQVHASQSTGFTPSSATLFGNITSLTGGNYTSLVTASGIWYIKFVAVDKTGNASAGSTQFQVTVLPAAVTSTSVGTLRNTDASMFQTPVTPGGLLVQTNATSNVDATAFDGNNIGSGTVTSGSNAVLTTIYTGLKPGQYRATFYMKVSTASGSAATTVCTLDIVAAGGVANNAQTITGAAFAANSRYFAITMPLFVTAASSNVQLVVKQGSSLTAWNLSHVTIDTANDTPTEFIRAASIVDAKIANMSADKIIAGTITATVGIGTLGILRAGTAGAARVDITSAGIAAYNGSNVNTFTLDASTGSVTVLAGTIAGWTINTTSLSNGTVSLNASTSIISGAIIQGGTVRTAASGLRWELASATNDTLTAYSGNASETLPGSLTVVPGTGVAAVAQIAIGPPNLGHGISSINCYSGAADGSQPGMIDIDSTKASASGVIHLYGSNVQIGGTSTNSVRVKWDQPSLSWTFPTGAVLDVPGMRFTFSRVTTSETTASTTYVGLTTAQTCTLTVPPSGAVMISMTAQMSNSGAGGSCLATVKIDDTTGGTTPLAAADNDCITIVSPAAGNSYTAARVFAVGSLTPGHSITVTMQYRVTGGTGTFLRRQLHVEPLI